MGTFHINEGETVKATLDAATVLLQNQQKQDLSNSKNGTDMIRYQNAKNLDPPSTGSSTLSNGSRYAATGDPMLAVQKRTTASPMVKNASPNLLIGTENSDYAVAVKPRPISVVKSETAASSPGAIRNANQASPIMDRRRAVAMFTYNNPGSNQLAFQEGDAILVIQDGQQGWQFGENLSTGK